MLTSLDDIIVLYLVMLICLTSGIVTTKVPWNFQPATSLQSPPLSYFPTTISAFPKVSQRAVFVNQATDNGLEDARVADRGFTERQIQAGYSYLKPLSIDLNLPFKDQKIESIADVQRLLKELQGTRGAAARGTAQTLIPSSTPSSRAEVEYHSHIPPRSSYQVVEEHDEYITDNSDDAGLSNRGKAHTTNPHRNSQDITTAIKALDHFLSRVLNDDSYNSGLHPSPNPILALILSRYGRYVPGARIPRVYAHMAVNNIHNNKPFGKYKMECDEVPTYVQR